MKKYIKIIVLMAFYIGLILLNTKVFATTATVSKDYVIIRQKATTNSEIVTVLSVKTEVEVLSKEGDWYKVEYKAGKTKYTGFIRGDLLKVNEEKTTEKTEDTNTSKNETTSENTVAQETTTTEKKETSEDVKDEIKENEKLTITSKIDLRILPLVNSSKIGEIAENSEIFATEVVGNWIHVENENVSGWVLSSKIKTKKDNETKNDSKEDNKEKETETKKNSEEKKTTETKTMYVSVTALNLREEAKTTSKVIDQLLLNDKVTVLEKVDNTWSKVKFSGKTGYVATEYLSSKKTETTSRSSDKERTNTANATTKKETAKTTTETKKSEAKAAETKTTETKKVETKTTENKKSSGVTGEDVVAYAKQFLGYKYVYGTAGPKTFDCSGFTSYVYKHFGYKLNRVANDQQRNGTAVKKSELRAGDIVCFRGHVGIYIGDGKFIHAENHNTGVVISKLSQNYYTKNYVTARRIIK